MSSSIKIVHVTGEFYYPLSKSVDITSDLTLADVPNEHILDANHHICCENPIYNAKKRRMHHKLDAFKKLKQIKIR